MFRKFGGEETLSGGKGVGSGRDPVPRVATARVHDQGREREPANGSVE